MVGRADQDLSQPPGLARHGEARHRRSLPAAGTGDKGRPDGRQSERFDRLDTSALHPRGWLLLAREAHTIAGQTVVVNLSGRGDKDVSQVMDILGDELGGAS